MLFLTQVHMNYKTETNKPEINIALFSNGCECVALHVNEFVACTIAKLSFLCSLQKSVVAQVCSKACVSDF